jgi:hypothetical protein
MPVPFHFLGIIYGLRFFFLLSRKTENKWSKAFALPEFLGECNAFAATATDNLPSCEAGLSGWRQHQCYKCTYR